MGIPLYQNFFLNDVSTHYCVSMCCEVCHKECVTNDSYNSKVYELFAFLEIKSKQISGCLDDITLKLLHYSYCPGNST